jgi:hypothetical protein
MTLKLKTEKVGNEQPVLMKIVCIHELVSDLSLLRNKISSLQEFFYINKMKTNLKHTHTKIKGLELELPL